MTHEELELITDILCRLYERDWKYRTSAIFPQAQLCMSGDEEIQLSGDSVNALRDHVRKRGNVCRIVCAEAMPISCKCFSVKGWLYFSPLNRSICLYLASWDQVEFLDKDLIRLHPAGEGGDPE